MHGRPLNTLDKTESFCDQAEPLRRRLLGYAKSLTHSHTDAEDLVQNALVAAYQRRGAIAAHGLFAYLKTCIRNEFINGLRTGKSGRRRVEISFTDYEVADEASGHTRTVSSLPAAVCLERDILNAMEQEKVIARIVQRAVNLRDIGTDLIYLHVIEGMTLDEIARRRDMSPQTVRSRLYRSLRRIRVRMGGMEGEQFTPSALL